MRKAFGRCAVMLSLALLASACATPRAAEPACQCGKGNQDGSEQKKGAGLSQQRLILSQGYSMLYRDATNVELSDLILYVKAESDAVEKVVTAFSEFGGGLKKDLERITRDYPGVKIDLDPLPEMEKRKRTAIGKDRALYFAPVVGHGGVEYERTVLIGFSNALNHERHLCEVMAAEEPDAGLKKFLLDTEKGYSRLYDQVMALLEKEYFKGERKAKK